MAHSHLAEVFGYPTDNLSPEAEKHRVEGVCPFNDEHFGCLKNQENPPLGNCSMQTPKGPTITCPTRFMQGGLVKEDAARFFGFPSGTWEVAPEVKLTDAAGHGVGNIDMVLVMRGADGEVEDFGSVEVQAVYISGNVRNPFRLYMEDREGRQHETYKGDKKPRPDYLSSFKRLILQVMRKGSILAEWGKRQAIAVDRHFFSTFLELPPVPQEEAEIAWLVYDLAFDRAGNRYNLELVETVYTTFEDALESLTTHEAGSEAEFRKRLRAKLDRLRFAPRQTSLPSD